MVEPATQYTFKVRALMQMILFVRLFVERMIIKEFKEKTPGFISTFRTHIYDHQLKEYADLWHISGAEAISVLGVVRSEKEIDCLTDRCIDELLEEYFSRCEDKSQVSTLVILTARYMKWLNRLINRDDHSNLDALQSVWNEPLSEDDAEKLIWRIKADISSQIVWSRFVQEIVAYVLTKALMTPDLSAEMRASPEQFACIHVAFNRHLLTRGLL